jgi:hypothetical protein
MSDYVKSNIGSGYNTVSSINTELENIETAIGTKMDKEGTTMSGDLDMGGNDILNAGEINGTEISADTIVVNGNSLTGAGSTDASANYNWTGVHNFSVAPTITIDAVEQTVLHTGNLNIAGLTINAQTGLTYSPLAGEENSTMTTMNNASANTYLITADVFSVGDVLAIAQVGDGTTTITGDTGVTVNSPVGYNLALYQQATALCIADNVWLLTGGLTA